MATRDTHVVTWKRTLTGWAAEQQHVSYLSAAPFVMEVVGEVEKLRAELVPAAVYAAASEMLSRTADAQARETYAGHCGCAHASLFAADCPRCLWGDR